MSSPSTTKPSRPHGPSRIVSLALDGWVLVLVLALAWPVSRPGQLLARDLVFASSPPLRPESFGLGSAAPRAVPLDAVVALLSQAVGGDLLGRLAIIGGLALAGGAAHRIARAAPLTARAVMAGLAVWNPFVSERLALGQWALLLAYAAAYVVVLLAPSVRAGQRSILALGPALALGALTPTGGLLVGALTAALVARCRRWVLALVAVAQLPWVLPVLLGASGSASSGEGLAAFVTRTERGGGALWTLLGLGGLWDSGSVPPSRAGLLGHLTSLVVVTLLVAAGWRRRASRADGRGHAGPSDPWEVPSWAPPGLWLMGGGGVLLAWVPTWPLAQRLLVEAMPVVPGLGLLRDSQKWLLPFVVLVVLLAGETTAAAERWLRARRPELVGGLVLLVAMPLLLLPDGGVRVWPTLTPVQTPTFVGQIADRVDGTAERLVTVPLRTYRRFDWGNAGLTVYDPASRWFDAPVVTMDRLMVGDLDVPGEDPVAAAVERAMVAPDRDEQLARLRVRWVVGYKDDPEFDAVDASAWSVVLQDSHMVLWEVPSTDLEPAWGRAQWSGSTVVMVLVLDGSVFLLLLLGWLVGGLVAARSSPSRKSRRLR